MTQNSTAIEGSSQPRVRSAAAPEATRRYAERGPADRSRGIRESAEVPARPGLCGGETRSERGRGLFDDGAALPLERSDIETVLAASALDWSEVDPSILGTLFERGLDPGKRAQLGAHYTDREKILQLVEPVVVRPLLAEWEREKAAIAAELERAEAARSRAARMKRRNEAERRYRAFLTRLREFTVLDPACGAGNFLYLALQALKDLEHRVQIEAETLGFPRAFPEVGPANVKGIEVNPYAAELARVSVWIGEIQWMRRNGSAEARNPILKPLDTIECRDAILTPDDLEPEWPAADVVIGNPPFLGGKLLNHAPGRGLRVADVRDVRRARAGGGGPGLLLVREGGPADRLRQGGAGRAGRDELDPGRREPAGAAGVDGHAPDLRGVERRAVGDRRGGGAGVAGLLLARRRQARVQRSAPTDCAACGADLRRESFDPAPGCPRCGSPDFAHPGPSSGFPPGPTDE